MSKRNAAKVKDNEVQESAVVEKAPEAVVAETAGKKSIVPSKYAGKYANGGSDDLAKFINAQCHTPATPEVKDGNKVQTPAVEGGFSFEKFFDLAQKNGIAVDHIKPFQDAIAGKANGAEGRARMTIRNRLAPIARKNGGLFGLDGEKVSLNVAAPPRSGAAAKNGQTQESAAA